MAPADPAGPAPSGPPSPPKPPPLRRASATRKRTSASSLMTALSRGSRASMDSPTAATVNEWGMGESEMMSDEPGTISRAGSHARTHSPARSRRSSSRSPSRPSSYFAFSPTTLTASHPPQPPIPTRSATGSSSVDIPRVMSPMSMSAESEPSGRVSRHQSARGRVDVLPSMPEGEVYARARGRTEPAVSFATPGADAVPPLPTTYSVPHAASLPSSTPFPITTPFPGTDPTSPVATTTSPISATSLPPSAAAFPAVLRPILTNLSSTAGQGTPISSTSTGSRSRPQLRLSTQDLVEPPSRKEDKPPLSPGMKHWQQVRQHVISAPSPVEAPKPKRGIVSRTAGRFGFRSVVENVLGYDRRRGSTYGAFAVDMTDEEREEASRERRRFARAVKTCLDECAAEESARRLRRLAAAGGQTASAQTQPPKPKSTHHSAHGGHGARSGSVHSSALLDDDGVSAFYPLLSALVKFGVDAKSKRVWSRTCPHHAAILAELGTAFLPDSASRDGERAQALQVVYTIVSHWSTDSEDDELDRWLWLCRAMLLDDRPTRERGLRLLSLILRGDPSIPEALARPASALDFEGVAIALLELLHALENSGYASDEHQAIVWDLLKSLGAGEIVAVSPESVLPLIEEEEVDVRSAERELLWLAAAKAIAADRHVGAWLLDRNADVLRRLAPPPVLPGMSEAVRKLRILADRTFLASFATLVRDVDDEDVVAAVADMAHEIYIEATDLPEREALDAGYASVLLALDCATATSAPESPYAARLKTLLAEHKDITPRVAQGFIAAFPPPQVMKAARQLLQADMPLGRACVPPLLEHLVSLPPSIEARSFLAWLATAQPQLFYKPLFACAAATQADSLAKPLRIVVALAEQLGPEAFWTRADPQMVAIVLGDMSPRKGKGKAKGNANVKLGRYALLIELLLGLQGVKGPQLATFALGLETRLGAMLELEERDGALPPVYRSLVAQLVRTLRVGSGLIKRTAATRLAVQWYTAPAWRATMPGHETGQVDSLVRLYRSDPEAAARNAPRVARLQVQMSEALPTLLVTAQASLASEDWGALLPVVWERYAGRDQPVDQLTFLMMKCAEAARGGLRNLVSTELYNAGPSVRSFALLKLAMLYGFRFQVYTQDTVTDRRGLNFRFPHRQLEFVVADMGSQVWVTPRDAQDAALQKYGRALPLELRQRLMQLGWIEDEEMTANDIERMPVTAVPPTGKGSIAIELKRAAAAPVIKRKGSNSSLHSNSGKVHRAVVPPDLVAIVIDQARQLAAADDIGVELLSKELVRMFERDDATLFMRPVSEELPHDISNALMRVNGVIAQPTPGFAHAALNALVGYLKSAVRNDSAFQHWAPLLGTIARLIPNVCEISLRDVRKAKSEHVLLPASIYETEGGFKLHRPWQEDVLLDVQAAQLVLLSAMLRANPRDVYLVKKMLFNLQVQESMRYLPFARAWVELIVDLFTTVNSNYNDRAELRHFLYNITAALSLHGGDMVVVAHGMRALALCATRFRRVFASIGFVNVMPPVYGVYVRGHGGIKDAVEYACRSFYRIHQDVFVYQLCLALAEGMADAAFDARAAYELLAVLSVGDDPRAGVPSGIRDLNKKYEVEALLQMQSGGAEVSLSELRPDAGDKRLASISLEPVVFPTDNIVRLLVTVIAVNAASKRGVRLMSLFAALAPHLQAVADERSRALLAEAVDVIGRFIQRMRSSDDTALQRLVPGDDGGGTDWPAARRAYVSLVDAFTSAGGAIGVHATRRLLDIVLQVLADGGNSNSIAGILGALARAHINAENSFLADLVPAYRQRIASVDFSGVLEAISALIRASAFRLPASLAHLIVDDYVGPALRMLSLASDEAMAFVVPLRRATVELLSLAVFLPGVDALHALERVPLSSGLLAAVVLPLALTLEPPPDNTNFPGLWVRILRLSLRAPRGPPLAQAAQAALALQIVKIAAIRVPDAISEHRGLWTYLATYAKAAVADGSGRFVARSPRLVDWMMWSLFELLALYRSPLSLALRLRIQTALSAVSDERDAASSRPSTAGTAGSGGSGPAPTPRSLSGLVRRPSARVPSSSGPPNLSPLAARVTSHSNTWGRGLAPVPENGNSLSPSGSPLIGPHRGSPGLSPGALHLRSPRAGSPHLSISAPATPTHRRSLSAASAASAASAYSNVSLTSPKASPIPIPHSPTRASPTPTAHSPTPSHTPLHTPSATTHTTHTTHDTHARTPSTSSATFTSAAARRSLAPAKPSFTLSARRASRGFDAFGLERRFSAAPRPAADRGTIVHLLGPASVAAGVATGSGPAALALAAGDPRRDALRSRLRSDVLADAARRGMLVTLVVYGYEVDEEVDVAAWSAPDALSAITEQTRVLVEDELGDVFNPPASVSAAELEAATEKAETEDEGDGGGSKRSSYTQPWDEEPPALNYTLNHGFEEYSFGTAESPRNSLMSVDRGHRRNMSRDIPTVAISHA